MNILSLLLLGIALSIDSLAASLTTGACTQKVNVRQIVKVGAVMALFQGAMPLVGWLVGYRFKPLIESYDHWIAFVLLLAIGGKLIYDSLKEQDETEAAKNNPSGLLFLVGMALATSIDAMIVGIGFGLVDVNIWLAMLIIGLTTFAFSTAGVALGKRIGTKFNTHIGLFGGLVLMALGTKILIEHIYFG